MRFCILANEWKTRYEIQAEINDQLRKQLPILTEKLEEAKGGKRKIFLNPLQLYFLDSASFQLRKVAVRTFGVSQPMD